MVLVQSISICLQPLIHFKSHLSEITHATQEMEKLRCLVIEKDKSDRELLRTYIEKLPMLELMAQMDSPLDALVYLQNNIVDLILLDFEMPALNGMDFLTLLNPRPLIIFTAARKENAWLGFQLDAVDYLIKPLLFQDFLKAINKSVRLFRLQNISNITLSSKPAEHYHLIIKSNRRVYRIPFADICYIEGMKEYVAIYTHNNNRLMILQSLKNLEEMLPAQQFIRIHKSYIIAIKNATMLEGNMLHLQTVKLPIGERYKNQVFKTVFS